MPAITLFSPPTEPLAARLERARAVATAAKAEYDSAQALLNRLKRAEELDRGRAIVATLTENQRECLRSKKKLGTMVRRGLAVLESKADSYYPARYGLTTEGRAAYEYLTTANADAVIEAALAADLE